MVILYSDNERLYQNSIVPFFIHMISKSTGLFVSQYIHIETGSGKRMIGWLFAATINIVHAYVDVGFSVCTV